jgi:cytoskeletal protein CcmA (bactofilin family)
MKEVKKTDVISGTINIISNGTEIIGDINANGDFRIDGSIQGNINSESKVVLGATGKITGSLNCENADVSGSVDGIVKIKELLFLKSTSNVKGDITTTKLVVESGAMLNGNCTMGSQQSDAPKEVKKGLSLNGSAKKEEHAEATA